MDKQQIVTAVIVGVLVVGIAVYRLLWVGSSAAAGAGLRRFPKTPGNLLKWFVGGSEGEKSRPQGPTGSSLR